MSFTAHTTLNKIKSHYGSHLEKSLNILNLIMILIIFLKKGAKIVWCFLKMQFSENFKNN